MFHLASLSLAFFALTSLVSGQDTTATKNAVKAVSCPRGTRSMVFQLDPDYADIYEKFISARKYPATMFYTNTATGSSEDECVPPGYLFAFQFAGPGTLDKDKSTYTLSEITLLEAGQAMDEAHKAIDAALNPDPNQEAQNLIDVLNSDGSSGLGQAFADSITPTPELLQLADTLQKLTEIEPAAVQVSPARKQRRLAPAIVLITPEIAETFSVAAGASTIPVAGWAIGAVIAAVGLLETAAHLLPGPDAYRSFSTQITYETTFYVPWIVTAGAPEDDDPKDPDISDDETQCTLEDMDDQEVPEIQLPGEGPCKVYLKNMIWNRPKVDWSAEIDKTVNTDVGSNKITGTLQVTCDIKGSSKWTNGNYWKRLLPGAGADGPGGVQSAEGESANSGNADDFEIDIQDMGDVPDDKSDEDCINIDLPEMRSKPYFTLDIGGEYSTLGSGYLEVDFGISMSMTGGSFSNIRTGTPGFSGNPNGLAGIDIYRMKAYGEQITVMLGAKAVAGIKYFEGEKELFDMGLSLTPGLWLSAIKETANRQITVSSAPAAATTMATSVSSSSSTATLVSSSSITIASVSSGSPTAVSVSPRSSTATSVSSGTSTANPTTLRTVFGRRDATATESSAASTTDAAPATLEDDKQLCFDAGNVKATVEFRAFAKLAKQLVYQQDIIPKSVKGKYLTFTTQGYEVCQTV